LPSAAIARAAGHGYQHRSYQPIERDFRITRQVLELCLEVGHPVTITTKSARVLDDLDLLRQLAARRLVAVGLSITSLDPRLSTLLEPRASSPAKRMARWARWWRPAFRARGRFADHPGDHRPFPGRNPDAGRGHGRALGQLDHAAPAPRSGRCSANGSTCISTIAPPK
jgi:hypothetical protein